MLTDTRRRITAILMAGAIALALSGCYTMKTETVYHVDGTVDSSVLIAMDDSVLADQFPDSDDPAKDFVDQTTNTPELDAMREQLGDRLTVEPYAQDGQSRVLMKMTGVTLEEVAKLNSSQSAPAGDTSLTHADGRLTLEYKADAELMENADEALSSLEGSGMDSAALSAIIDFEARHTFPGAVVSTTIGEIDPENPNSVIITDLASANSAQQYTIVASDGSSGSNGLSVMWIVIAIAGLLVLAAVAGLIIWRVRTSRKAVAAPVEAASGDEAIASVATQAAADQPEAPAAPAAPEDVKE